MQHFIVSYDLDKPGQNYLPLIQRLKQLGAIELLRSDWLLANPASAASVRDDLMRFMDSNDRIFVGILSGEAAWSNPLVSSEVIKKTFAA